MVQKTRKPRKRCNGAGESITFKFDKSDPQEAAALAMSKLLAAKHGRRKDAIVAMLAAMYEHYQTTGEMMTPGTITSALSGGQRREALGFISAVSRQQVGRGDMGFSGGIPSGIAMMELPSGQMFDDGDEPLIQVVDAAPAGAGDGYHASSAEIALNHAMELGDLFGD